MNMELTQVISNIVYYYMIFCLVTAICTVYLNIKVFRIAKPPLNFSGKLTYFTTMAAMSFIFAPIFFLVFIFYSQTYIDGAVERVKKTFGDESI